MAEATIVVNEVGKRFRRYDPDRPWTFQEAFFQRLRGHRPAQHFWVLRDISFSVGRGKTVGLIGRNGAGKSTLLRLIGGIGRAERGRVRVYGRISGLLDLGVGFHSDLTGRENVFISGVIGGLTRQEVADRFDAIVDFAELRGSIDSPLRTYSSGMHMRLAFATAIHTEPDVLLIDEVLAVGDIGFQHKCLERIAELKRKGCTIVMVSHDPGLVSKICDQVLWLEQGRVKEFGSASQVVGHYVYEMETLRRTPENLAPVTASSGVELKLHQNRFGSLELELDKVRILDGYEQPTAALHDASPLTVEMSYRVADVVRSPIFGVTIINEVGQTCYVTTSERSPARIEEARASGIVSVRIDDLALVDGHYFVDVGAYERAWAYGYDYHAKAYPIIVRRNGNGSKSGNAQAARAIWSAR